MSIKKFMEKTPTRTRLLIISISMRLYSKINQGLKIKKFRILCREKTFLTEGSKVYKDNYQDRAQIKKKKKLEEQFPFVLR
jgi:hypothetical protein